MTRERLYGSDTPFCAWLRACKELPSYSKNAGIVAADNDVTIHRYLSDVDSIGTREVQAIMQLEVKTRQGEPSVSQIDTLCKLNWFAGQKTVDGQTVRFFGIFFLIMSGTSPDDSQKMWWGSIPKTILTDARQIKWRKVSREDLILLLRFELHPATLCTRPFRRHHLTQELIVVEKSPLGFDVETKVIKRS